MPKFISNPTQIDTQRDTLADMSELAGQIYSHIRLMTKTSGGEHKFQRQQAKDKCKDLLRMLGG